MSDPWEDTNNTASTVEFRAASICSLSEADEDGVYGRMSMRDVSVSAPA